MMCYYLNVQFRGQRVEAVGTHRDHHATECETCDVPSSFITVYLTSSVSCSHSVLRDSLAETNVRKKKK